MTVSHQEKSMNPDEDEELNALDPPEDPDEDEAGEEDDDEGTEGSTEDAQGEKDEVDGTGEGEEQEVVPARRNSARETIRTLRQRAQEAEDRAARIEREVQEARAAAQRAQPKESREDREARLALMDPEQRSEFRLNEALEQNRRDMALMQFQMQDTADRTSFEAKAATDKLYAKWAPKVEAELADLRRQGQNVSREQLFAYLVGKSALEGRGKTSPKQAREGQRRVKAATSRPTNGRGDVGADRRRSGDSPAKRLEGIEI
jgi:hypothetical protein